MAIPQSYDDWKLESPEDEAVRLGRYHYDDEPEPDEDEELCPHGIGFDEECEECDEEGELSA